MANSTTTQIMLDGPRNVVVKFEGVLDTADLAQQVILDPATLVGIDWTLAVKAAKLKIMDIQFNVEDALSVNLFWDATVPVRIGEYTGRGEDCYEKFGGIQNNAGTGVTGKILASTEGAAAGQFRSFLIVLHCIKQQT